MLNLHFWEIGLSNLNVKRSYKGIRIEGWRYFVYICAVYAYQTNFSCEEIRKWRSLAFVPGFMFVEATLYSNDIHQSIYERDAIWSYTEEWAN